MNRRLTFIISLIVATASLGMMLFTPGLLVESITPGLPVGTLSSWLGIIALPVALITGTSGIHKQETGPLAVYKHLLIIAIYAAIAWGFVGHYLAANWSFSFSAAATGFRGSPAASAWFWNYTYFTLGFPVVVWLVFLVHRRAERKKG